MGPWESSWHIFWISEGKEPLNAGAVSTEELDRTKIRVLV